MYSVYAGMSAGVVFALIILVSNRQWSIVAKVETVLVGAALGGILGITVATARGVGASQHWEEYGTFRLASVDDRTSYRGTFVFGSGTFGQTEKYRFRYWIKRPGGLATTVRTVSVGNSYIHEDATDSTACLVQRRSVLKPPQGRNWVFDTWTSWENDFHVPPGSVRTGYNIQ